MPYALINLSLSIHPHWWNRNEHPIFSLLLLLLCLLLELFLLPLALFTSWVAGGSGAYSDDGNCNSCYLLCTFHTVLCMLMCQTLIFPLQSSNNLRTRTLLSPFSHKEAQTEKKKKILPRKQSRQRWASLKAMPSPNYIMSFNLYSII